MHWAKPGVQCVCINDQWVYLGNSDIPLPPRVPVLREKLTVSVVSQYADIIVVQFEEIDGQDDSWFDADHFRPLVKRATDISIFTDMLTPAPNDVVPA